MSASDTAAPTRANAQNLPLVLILLVLDSFHLVFAKLLTPLISPRVSAFYVMAIATVVVGIYGLATRRLSGAILRQHWRFLTAIGFLIALSTNLTYVAVEYIDPGTASLIGQLSTPLSIVIGIVWLKEHFSHLQLLGAVLAVAGAIVIALQPGVELRLGALLMVIAIMAYTTHTALVKRNGDVDFLNFFFFRLLFTSLALFIFSAAQSAVIWPSTAAWPWLVLVGMTDIVVSRTLYYLALRRLNLSAHAVMLTVSPVLAVGWSLLFFYKVPSAQQIIGGVIVIFGVLLATQVLQRLLLSNRDARAV